MTVQGDKNKVNEKINPLNIQNLPQEKVETPDLDATQIAKLNSIIGNIDDDDDGADGDLTNEQIDELRTIFFNEKTEK